MTTGSARITQDRLEAAKKLSAQIVLRDGTELPQDIYVLTRTLFRLLHGGCTPAEALSVLSERG